MCQDSSKHGEVEAGVDRFELGLSPTTDHVQKPETLKASARQATLSCLGSAIRYNATVITVYHDGMEVRSDPKAFISPGIIIDQTSSLL